MYQSCEWQYDVINIINFDSWNVKTVENTFSVMQHVSCQLPLLASKTEKWLFEFLSSTAAIVLSINKISFKSKVRLEAVRETINLIQIVVFYIYTRKPLSNKSYNFILSC